MINSQKVISRDVKSFRESLYQKIRILNETVWENRVDRKRIDRWLDNFSADEERTHALFLLSQFMYFGSLQMRELLKVLYRDLYRSRVIEEIRLQNANTIDIKFIESEYTNRLNDTRFLGVGNPSESGTHLLYFFRQENKIPKSLFIESSKIFDRVSNNPISLADNTVREFVFLDDLCGSGTQAKAYSDQIVDTVKRLDSNIQISYLMLFASKSGIDYIRKYTNFDNVEAIFELDNSFKCFNPASRYFKVYPANHIDPQYAESFCDRYGMTLMESICLKEGVSPVDITTVAKEHCLGFRDSQLMIGFHHNTPDNSLPIFWYDEEEVNWYPIFRRYNKIYG